MSRNRRPHRTPLLVTLVMATIASSFGAIAVSTSAGAAAPVGIAKINHVVVMMQENRSYDSYFAPAALSGSAGVGGRTADREPEPERRRDRSIRSSRRPRARPPT